MQTEPHAISPSRIERLSSSPARHRDAALGLISTQSFPAIVGTADMMTKSADVVLVGYEKTGNGFCTAVVRGGVADVRMAIHAGVETAQKFGQYLSSLVIPRPSPNLEEVLPIRVLWEEFAFESSGSRASNQALGLLETRGFPAMVGAADAMTKSADVQLVAHESIGSGLCTALIRGTLPNVALAVEAGMHEAERIGELHAVMVIPRPLDDLERSLPSVRQPQVAQQPLEMPLSLQEEAREFLALQAQAETRSPLELAQPLETDTPEPLDIEADREEANSATHYATEPTPESPSAPPLPPLPQQEESLEDYL